MKLIKKNFSLVPDNTPVSDNTYYLIFDQNWVFIRIIGDANIYSTLTLYRLL